MSEKIWKFFFMEINKKKLDIMINDLIFWIYFGFIISIVIFYIYRWIKRRIFFSKYMPKYLIRKFIGMDKKQYKRFSKISNDPEFFKEFEDVFYPSSGGINYEGLDVFHSDIREELDCSKMKIWGLEND